MVTEFLSPDATNDNAACMFGGDEVQWLIYRHHGLIVVWSALRGDFRNGVVTTGPRAGTTIILAYYGVWELAEVGAKGSRRAATWQGLAAMLDNTYGALDALADMLR